MPAYTDISSISDQDLLTRFKEKQEFSFIIPFSSRESDAFVARVLLVVLDIINQKRLHPSLEYSLRELVMNASKANTKRLYFKGRDLDITKSLDYKKGIESFKNDVFADFS